MENIKKEIIAFVRDLAIGAAICFILVSFIFQPAQIKGTSMMPNLKDGSYTVLGKINLIFGIERFDIVSIENENLVDPIIKRVIGLPNETVEYMDNKLYINGILVNEDFERIGDTEDFYIELGNDEYFVLGDNRINSKDSRVYGAFSLDDFKTRGVWIAIGGKN